MSKLQKFLTGMVVVVIICTVGNYVSLIHKVKSAIFSDYNSEISIGQAIDEQIGNGHWTAQLDPEYVSYGNGNGAEICFDINEDDNTITISHINIDGDVYDDDFSIGSFLEELFSYYDEEE